MKKAVLLLSVVVCMGVITGVSRSESIITQIDEWVQKCENSTTAVEIALGTIELANYVISDWQIINPTQEQNYNDEAHLYFEGKRLTSAHVRYGTPTGDWGEHTYYCYWENGNLAYILYEYWSFCDGSIGQETILYFKNGKIIKKTTRYFDLETQKPVKLKKGSYKPAIYLTTKDILDKFSKDLKGSIPPWSGL
jgi:hypothetical protein